MDNLQQAQVNGVPTVGAIKATGRPVDEVLNPPPLPRPPTSTPPPKPAAQTFMDRATSLQERAQAGLAKLFPPTMPPVDSEGEVVAPTAPEAPSGSTGAVYAMMLRRNSNAS